MSKYPRQQSGLFGLDTTAFLWTVIGAALLGGGFFLFGMYYGYQRGYQAARQSMGEGDNQGKRVASARQGSSETGDETRSASSEDQPSAITEEQLKGFGTGDDEGESSSDDSSFSRTMSTGRGASSENDRQSTARGDRTGGSSPDQSRTDDNSQTTNQTRERPRSLSVSDVDTGQDEPDRTERTTARTSTDEEESTVGDRETSEAEGNESENAGSDQPTYTIQAVSFLKQSRAKREVQELKSAGYNATITKKVINGREWFRVRVGSFSDRNEANDQAEEMVKKEVIKDYWISRVEK